MTLSFFIYVKDNLLVLFSIKKFTSGPCISAVTAIINITCKTNKI